MPEWSISISGPKGAVKLDPNPQEVYSGDLVSWANRSNEPRNIIIDNPPGTPPLSAAARMRTNMDCQRMIRC